MSSELDYQPFRLSERASTDPLLGRLAVLVREKGVDPHSCFIGDIFPDDHRFLFGLLVTGAGKVFQFGYDFLGSDEASGHLSEWNDLTDSWQSSNYVGAVKAAFALAGTTT